MSFTFADRDEFNRKTIAENMIKLLQSEADVSPMMLDGSWGTGKTEFCLKTMELFGQKKSHQLIYIDAFKADHADEPLLTLLAEVLKLIPEGDSQKTFIKKIVPAARYGVKTLLKAGVGHVLRQDFSDAANDFDKEKLVSAVLKKKTKSIKASAVRFLYPTIIGLFNAPLGITASAIDSFFIPKLLDNWSPEVYLDEKIASFIEKKQKRSIPEIVEQDGVETFRQIETEYLKEIIEKGTRIISLGGGAWLTEANRDMVKENNCTSVWLESTFEHCWRNISMSKKVRPLVKNKDQARELFEERVRFYCLAEWHFVVNPGFNSFEIAKQISSEVFSL